MVYGKGSVRCWNAGDHQYDTHKGHAEGYTLATNLRHDHHQSNRTDVGALPAHVAPCDDLEPRLLCGIHVVRNKLGMHNLFLDRMSSLLNGQCIGQLWLGCGSISTQGLPPETLVVTYCNR